MFAGDAEEQRGDRHGGCLFWHPASALVLLPVVSWVLQWRLSVAGQTAEAFWSHSTVQLADWAFLLINPLIARGIDWSRGAILLAGAFAALVANVLVHWVWQMTGADPGHLISDEGVTLAAGWVHLCFATCESSLIVGWIICRRSDTPARQRLFGDLSVLLYLGLAIPSGVWLQGRLAPTDAMVFLSGVVVVVLRIWWDRRNAG